MLALALSLLAGAADVPTVDEAPVVRVVVTGTRRVEPAVVLAATQTRAGRVLTAGQARAELESIYATGLFDDVRLVASPEGDGVVLEIRVVERPAYHGLVLTGVRDGDEEDVRELVDLRPYEVPSDRQIDEAVRRIRAHFTDDGYFLAEVTPSREPVADGLFDLHVAVEQGRKVLVRRVEIAGNDGVGDARIRKFLSTRAGGPVPWLTQRGAFSEAALEDDARTLHALYWEEGYLDVDVATPRAYLTPDRRFVEVHFTVDEGTRYDIGAVDVAGEFHPDLGLTRDAAMRIVDGWSAEAVEEDQWRLASGLRSLRRPRGTDEPALRTGDTFRYSTYGAVSARLQTLYEDRGFAEPIVSPSFQTRPDRSIVDLTFRITPGQRVRIGRIDITGNDPTFDRIVRRELLLDEGDWYAGSLARASRLRLLRLGWFDDVTVATRPSTDTEEAVDLAVNVVEKPTGMFNAGLGYGGSVGGLSAMVSGSKENFLGLGLGFSGAFNWSGLARDGSLAVSDPRFLDSRWSLEGAAYRRTVAVGNTPLGGTFDLSASGRREVVWGGFAGVGRAFGRQGDVHVDLRYTLEDRQLRSITQTERRMLGGQLFRDGLTSKVGVSVVFDERDSPVAPRRGWYLSARGELAGGARVSKDSVVSLLGGEFFYGETQVDFRFYQPFVPKAPRSPVFRLHAAWAHTWSLDGTVVPYVARYRAGGILSVRGYQEQSLGPRLRLVDNEDPTRADDAIVVGGTESFVANAEIEFPLVPGRFTGVVFFDAGNTFGDPWTGGRFDPFDLRTSIGIGGRVMTPMGLLRLELGLPLSRDPAIRKQIVGFTIGGTF